MVPILKTVTCKTSELSQTIYNLNLDGWTVTAGKIDPLRQDYMILQLCTHGKTSKLDPARLRHISI